MTRALQFFRTQGFRYSLQLRTRPRTDRIQELYKRFCQKLARIGLQRDPWEGPSDFATRAAESLPNESERVRQITKTYIALRYAPDLARLTSMNSQRK